MLYIRSYIYLFLSTPFLLQLHPTPTVTGANQGNQDPRAVPPPRSPPLRRTPPAAAFPAPPSCSWCHGLKIQLSHERRRGRAAVISRTGAACRWWKAHRGRLFFIHHPR